MKHNKQKAINITIWAVLITTVVVMFANYCIQNTEVFKSGTMKYEAVVEEVVLPIVVRKTIEEKVNELKDEVRNKIMKKESAGIVVEKGELFPTFDPRQSMKEQCRRVGGKMDLDCLSFGPLQFKLSTIIWYESKLNGNEITEMEALIIAHDIKKASKMFDDIVYGAEGGIWNWTMAQHDKDYYVTVIPIIRKLME